MNKQGDLFVISGGDGSGKTVQSGLLLEHMISDGFKAEPESFPRYETPAGRMIKAALAGQFGDPTTIDPFVMTHLFAADRHAAAPAMRAKLRAGIHIVANRYLEDNWAHQGTKIPDLAAWRAFCDWEARLEYEVNAIPEPRLNIILHVPVDVSLNLIEARSRETGVAMDGHETRAHLELAERTFRELPKIAPRFQLIECGTPDGQSILSKEEIHEKVWAIVAPLLAA